MKTSFDVIIIGGGPAGLSATLVLGRALRHTLLLDNALPRNRFAGHSHGFFTRDGAPPLDLLDEGRRQLQPYETVSALAMEAVQIQKSEDGFTVTLADGSVLHSRALVLATGLRDVLPPIPGLQELWGSKVVLCPFCHGYEVRHQPWAVLGNGDMGFMRLELLHGWTHDLTLLTNGPSTLNADQLAAAARHHIPVIEEEIEAVADQGTRVGIRLRGGRVVNAAVLFVIPEMVSRATALGLPYEITGTDWRQIAMEGQTNVPGLYVVGDVSGAPQSIAGAAASGNALAGAVHHFLSKQDFYR